MADAFHGKARKALLKELLSGLASSRLERGEPIVRDACFDAFRRLVLKERGEWLEANDVNEILLRFISINLTDQARDFSGPLTDDLGYGPETAEAILDFVESIPRTYTVLFPLPRFSLSNDIELANDVALIRTPSKPTPIGILGIYSPRGNYTYLKVRAQGYVLTHPSQSAMRHALSLAKRSLHVGTVRHVFFLDRSRKLQQSIAESRGNPSDRFHSALAIDDEDHEAACFVRLDLNTSWALDALTINYDKTPAPPPLPRPILSKRGLEADLKRLLAPQVALVTDGGQPQEHTKSLRSALEWAFDADADDNPVLSFIKKCIAIEAALGDDDSEAGQLTQRLADRCAFLLYKTPTERAAARDKMKKMYKLRSALVHGVQTTLSNSDREVALSAVNYLSQILATELEAVEGWWVIHRALRPT